MKEFGSEKIIVDKMTAVRTFVYAWIVPLWAYQLLPQFLIEQFDALQLQ